MIKGGTKKLADFAMQQSLKNMDCVCRQKQWSFIGTKSQCISERWVGLKAPTVSLVKRAIKLDFNLADLKDFAKGSFIVLSAWKLGEIFGRGSMFGYHDKKHKAIFKDYEF